MNNIVFPLTILILTFVATMLSVRWQTIMNNLILGRKTKITKLTYLNYAIFPIVMIVVLILKITLYPEPIELNHKMIEVLIGMILLILGFIQVNPLTKDWSIKLTKFFNELHGVESKISYTTMRWIFVSGVIELLIGGYTLYSNLILNSPFLIKFITK